MSECLVIHDLQVDYGLVSALNGVSLHVGNAELVAVVGPNGAGKSTLLNTVAGLLPSRTGKILFSGGSIGGKAAEEVVRLGLALVPERRQLFGSLSVRDNLLLGGYHRRRRASEVAGDLEWVYDLFPMLREHSGRNARVLSGGQQQMLAIARGLMSRPRLLLLDEPSLGLAPLVVKDILRLLAALPRQSISVLLVEQNAAAAFAIANQIYVMERGRIVAQGAPSELAASPEIRRAYLGGGQAISPANSNLAGRAVRP